MPFLAFDYPVYFNLFRCAEYLLAFDYIYSLFAPAFYHPMRLSPLI